MQPMQQCLVLNAWLTTVLGAVLPLFIQSRLEAAARRRFYARQQQQQQQQQHGEQSRQGGTELQVYPMEWSALYFCSFLLWQLADVAYSLPHMLGTA